MNLTVPPQLAAWLTRNSPELNEVGGPESLEIKVVDRLPFSFVLPSRIDAIVVKEVIYLKKSWFSKYKTSNSTYLPVHTRFLHLFFHEIWHVISQRKYWGPFWCWLLFHYLPFHKKEEHNAHEYRDKLYAKYI